MDQVASSPSNLESTIIVAELSEAFTTSLNSFEEAQNERFRSITELQDKQFKEMEDLVSQLRSHSDSLETHAGVTDDGVDIHPSPVPSTETLKNPTKCFNDYTPEFVPEDLSMALVDFLDQCGDFNVNKERGHAVAIIGYPYNYTNAKHPGNATDIPEPLQKVIDLIKDSYPGQEQVHRTISSLTQTL